jgi:long-chain acyl-CoA synthetase
MSKSTTFKSPLDYLLLNAVESPKANALTISGTEMDYSEFFESVMRRAGFFKKSGVGRNAKVAIYTNNDFLIVESIFALWALGAVCVPMNITQKPDKLMQIEKTIEPDIGFIASDITIEYPHKFPVSDFSGEGEMIDKVSPADPDDIGMIMFTSGTSGVPKAVPWTHRAMVHNTLMTSKYLGITKEDKIFINTPPYTVSSILHILTMFAGGAGTVIERGFHFGAGLLNQIANFECTCFGGVPVHFARILATVADTKVPPKLRFMMNSGDHLPVPVIKGLINAMPSIQIFCVYGIGEVTGRLCFLDPKDIDRKAGSVGFPIEGMSISIRDDSGKKLDPFLEGQVYVSGPSLMEGYINSPEINAQVMTPSGFATGDFGYIDDEGYLFLRGRRDDIMKVGGEKVSLKMIEEAIYGFEAFKEFMVAPFDDEHMGNVPYVYYVLEKGCKFNKRTLIRHLKKLLPQTYVPSHFVEVKSIPRTGSGKAIRKAFPADLIIK